MPIIKKRKGEETLIVAGSEEDGASIVTDKALSDSGLAELWGSRTIFWQNGFGLQDIDGQIVTIGSRF